MVVRLKAIQAKEDREEAENKAAAVIQELEAMKLARAAMIVREGVLETLGSLPSVVPLPVAS